MTGNSKYNQKFKRNSEEDYGILDEVTGELHPPEAFEFIDESSVMISGIVLLSIEDEDGNPLYVNQDKNSPNAFRPNKFEFVVCISFCIQNCDVSSSYILSNYSKSDIISLNISIF